VLRKWVDEHEKPAFPSSEEKEHLAPESGLSIKQVSHWFNNYRKRKRSIAYITTLVTIPVPNCS